MLAKKLWVSKNFDLGVSNVLLQGLEFSNRFSESPVFAFLHFYNNVVIFNDFFFISAVFASQTFLVKVTQANRQMMMMTRMMMKRRMMMKTKAGVFFSKPFQCSEQFMWKWWSLRYDRTGGVYF